MVIFCENKLTKFFFSFFYLFWFRDLSEHGHTGIRSNLKSIRFLNAKHNEIPV